MATQTEILRIEVDNKQAQKNIEDQTKKIEELKEENKQLASINKKLAKQEGDTSKERARNSENIAKNAAVIAKNTQQRKQNISVLQNEKNTLNNLRSQLALLTAERNKNLVVGTKAFDEANERIKALNDQIKEAEQGGGDFRRSVGSYSEALQNAIPSLGGFTGGIKALGVAFVSNPIGAIITALVVALTALFNIFKETAIGAELLSKGMAVLSGAFDTLTGWVSGNTSSLKDNIKESLRLEAEQKRLAKTANETARVVSFLTRSQEALSAKSQDSTLSFEEQSDALEKLQNVQDLIFKKREKQASDELQLAQDRLKQAKTNGKVTIDLEKEVADKEVELQGIRTEANKARIENAQTNRQILQDIWEQELDFIIDVGEKERETFETIATDEKTSFKERTKALEDYQSNYESFLEAQRDQFNEIGLSDEEIDRLLGIKNPRELAKAITDIEGLTEIEKNRLREVFIELKNSEIEKEKVVKKFNEIRTKEINEVKQKEIDAINKVKEANKKAEKEKNKELKKQKEATFELELFRKERDSQELQDADKKAKALIEIEKFKLKMLLENESLIETERELLIEKSEQNIIDIKANAKAEKQKLSDETAKKEADLREKETKEIERSEKENEKLRKQRLENGINLTQSAVRLASTILGEETKAGKALAIAAAGINTAQAVTKTLATGGALAIPQAAVVGGLGAAQIAKIKSTDVSGGSGGGSTPNVSTPTIPNTPQQVDTSNVDNQVNQQEALINALESQRFEVSVSEINDVQNAVSVSENDSTI